MALSGAEPVRLSTIRAFQERFGVGDVFAPAYGLAEATLAVAVWPHGQPVRADPTESFVSVGRPCRGVRVEIAGADGVGRAGPGEVGEILVQSPGVMQGYYRDPEATARALRGGWLHTGDLGFVDRDGYLFITGRIKDVIIVRGQNVVPADVEEAADHVAGVRYSAAVGIESERTGTQRLHVVVEVRGDGLAPEELSRIAHDVTQAVRRRSGLRPARVLLVQPQTIPKTSSGKIQRAALAAMGEPRPPSHGGDRARAGRGRRPPLTGLLPLRLAGALLGVAVWVSQNVLALQEELVPTADRVGRLEAMAYRRRA
jgi:acyl-CoA synthetase (AMP-forming)/AMP-acid ligase II